MLKRMIVSLLTAFAIFAASAPAYADDLLFISAGTPISHSFKDSDVAESDGVSGTFVHAKLPFLVGLGLETYSTGIKDSVITLDTTIYDIYYTLPIPIIDIAFGVGAGSSELSCDGCAAVYDKGSVTQTFIWLGVPIFPFFDIHVSSHNVNNKIKVSSTGTEIDFSGSVTAVGIGFGF